MGAGRWQARERSDANDDGSGRSLGPRRFASINSVQCAMGGETSEKHCLRVNLKEATAGAASTASTLRNARPCWRLGLRTGLRTSPNQSPVLCLPLSEAPVRYLYHGICRWVIASFPGVINLWRNPNIFQRYLPSPLRTSRDTHPTRKSQDGSVNTSFDTTVSDVGRIVADLVPCRLRYLISPSEPHPGT